MRDIASCISLSGPASLLLLQVARIRRMMSTLLFLHFLHCCVVWKGELLIFWYFAYFLRGFLARVDAGGLRKGKGGCLLKRGVCLHFVTAHFGRYFLASTPLLALSYVTFQTHFWYSVLSIHCNPSAKNMQLWLSELMTGW